MTGEIAAAGAAAKSAANAVAGLAGDAEDRKNMAEIAKDSRASEIAANARAERIAIVQLAIRKTVEPLARWVGYRQNYFQDQFEADLAEKMQDVPEEHIISPNPAVFFQAAEGLAYSLDEPDLKEMYLNLIARASDDRISESVHPSFAQIIKQLTAREAVMLQQLGAWGKPGVPIVSVRHHPDDGPGFHVLYRHVSDVVNIETGESVDYGTLPVYVDNWERLGVARADYRIFRTGPNAYDWVETRPEVKRARADIGEGARIEIERGVLRLTDYGVRFLEAVGASGTVESGSASEGDAPEPNTPEDGEGKS